MKDETQDVLYIPIMSRRACARSADLLVSHEVRMGDKKEAKVVMW